MRASTKPAGPVRSRNWLWPALLSLLAIISGFVVVDVWSLLYPKPQIVAEADPDCDLRAGPCTTVLGDGRSVRFSVEPRSIPPLLPLRLTVEAGDFSVREVRVELNGQGMNMGLNRVVLSERGEGRYAGTASLSVCIRDAMEWEAVVSLDEEDALTRVPFRFITVKSGAGP